jgi:hypothetical protein
MAKPTKLPKAPALSALELHAVKIIGRKAEKQRDKLQVGSGQPIDLVLHISGAIDVQPNIKFDSIEKPTVEDVLALAMAKLPPRTRATFVDRLQGAYRNARAGKPPRVKDEARKAAEELLVTLSRPCVKKQRGGVVGSLKIERLAG